LRSGFRKQQQNGESSSRLNMANLQIELDLPEITPAQSLAGWHREFCVQVLGDGAARVFVRAVGTVSSKAQELHQGILFQRLGPRFSDLVACIDAIRFDLERFVLTARRVEPVSTNLFRVIEYDRVAWERVQHGLERWGRR
jgi:hypothetical protein